MEIHNQTESNSNMFRVNLGEVIITASESTDNNEISMEQAPVIEHHASLNVNPGIESNNNE